MNDHAAFFGLCSLVLLSICILTGCDRFSSSGESDSKSAEPLSAPLAGDALPLKPRLPIPDGDYLLTTLDSRPYPDHGPEVTLSIHANRISGKAPVNRYHGMLHQGKTGPIATTMMAGPPADMQLESLFLKHLAEAEFEVAANHTLIIRQQGIAHMIFKKDPNSDSLSP
jgi:heat shock protein HslJ